MLLILKLWLHYFTQTNRINKSSNLHFHFLIDVAHFTTLLKKKPEENASKFLKKIQLENKITK